jgi:hypothetical protein
MTEKEKKRFRGAIETYRGMGMPENKIREMIDKLIYDCISRHRIVPVGAGEIEQLFQPEGASATVSDASHHPDHRHE